MIDSGSGRGAARADGDQGSPTQSHISPSILVYEDWDVMADDGSVGTYLVADLPL